MKSWKKRIKESIERMAHYFQSSQSAIIDSNLSLMKGICLSGFMVISFLMLVAYFLLENWTLSTGHVLFLPFFVIYYIWADYRQKKHIYDMVIVQRMVLTFMCAFMALVVYIETVPYPEKVATLVTPAMIVLPVVLILPFTTTFLYLLISYLFFLFFSFISSDISIVRSNAFNGLVGVLFGFLVAWIVTNLRAREEHAKEAIIKKSQQDNLTGILNKSAVEQECFTYLDLYGDESCVMIVIDVDSFKTVNDSYGHQSGDQVLSIFGNALTKVFRDKDIIGRIGGDEFVVLMKNVSEKDMVVKRMDFFSELFTKTTEEQLGYKSTCSYGAVVKNQGYMPYGPLFEYADKLLYQSKRQGRARGFVQTITEIKNKE